MTFYHIKSNVGANGLFVRLAIFALLSLMTSDLLGQTLEYATNAPRIGDVVVKRQAEYFNPGNSGDDILWDFRNIEMTGKDNPTEFYQGNDSLLLSADDTCLFRYRLVSDSLQLYGYETPYVKIGYTAPLALLTFPCAYGYTVTNCYEGTGMYCNKNNISSKGTLIVEADGAGSVITASGDTLSNALRLHSIRTSSVCMYAQTDTLFVDSTYMKQEVQETYQWYVKGYRYPLYETISTSYYDNMTPVSCVQKAYACSTEDQAMLDDPINRIVLEEIHKEENKNADIIHYTVSNNGYTLQLHYSLDGEANVNALVCNSRGMVYERQNYHMQAGSGYQMSFDIMSLPRDEYVLYINVNGRVYNEKFETRR